MSSFYFFNVSGKCLCPLNIKYLPAKHDAYKKLGWTDQEKAYAVLALAKTHSFFKENSNILRDKYKR